MKMQFKFINAVVEENYDTSFILGRLFFLFLIGLNQLQ